MLLEVMKTMSSSVEGKGKRLLFWVFIVFQGGLEIFVSAVFFSKIKTLLSQCLPPPSKLSRNLTKYGICNGLPAENGVC